MSIPLGVVGFELFTGQLALDVASGRLSKAARIVCEFQPAAPGTLNADCRGDLEVVIAKALEKNPSRRYASAGALAADLRRGLCMIRFLPGLLCCRINSAAWHVVTGASLQV